VPVADQVQQQLARQGFDLDRLPVLQEFTRLEVGHVPSEANATFRFVVPVECW
jgi:hypothetical protein